MQGLRLVLSAEVPGPWGEAAKSLFYVRGVPFTPVSQIPAEANEELVAWTGVRNAPVAVYNREAPRTSWLDILMLAERLGKGPSLLPANPSLRAQCVGMAHELCGEWGWGWCRRLMIFADLWGDPTDVAREDVPEVQRRLGKQYDYRPETLALAPQRATAILSMLRSKLQEQEHAGSPYLVGNRLSAADIYWATFSAMLQPMPHELNPMPDYLRATYAKGQALVDGTDLEWLLRHRDFIYRNHLKLPLEF